MKQESLPPKHDPIWKRMEDDVASGKWPKPLPFYWIWFKGPKHERLRRSTFRIALDLRFDREWNLWMAVTGVVGVGSAVLAAYSHHVRYLSSAMIPAALVADFLWNRAYVDSSLRRYLRSHSEA